MASTETVVQPTAEPVSLTELKAHLRINVSDSTEDALLASYVTAARVQFERLTNRAVLPTTFRQSFGVWGRPGVWTAPGVVPLLRGKATSVSAVRYYDGNDTLQTVTGWAADLSGVVGYVWFPVGTGTTAQVSPTRPRPWAVEYVAGWPDVASVPQPIKVAVLQLAAHFYANRESVTDKPLGDIPNGFRRVCDLYTLGLKGGQGI